LHVLLEKGNPLDDDGVKKGEVDTSAARDFSITEVDNDSNCLIYYIVCCLWPPMWFDRNSCNHPTCCCSCDCDDCCEPAKGPGGYGDGDYSYGCDIDIDVGDYDCGGYDFDFDVDCDVDCDCDCDID